MSVSRGAVLILAVLLALSVGAPPAASVGGAGLAGGGASEAARVAVPAAEAESPAAPLPQRTRVRMGLIHSIGATAYYLTQDRGYFAAENLEVEWEPIPVTSDAIVHVASGQLDLAAVTVGAAVLNGMARGLDLRIIGGGYGHAPAAPGGAPILARKDLYDAGEVRSTADLRGRRVGGNGRGVFTEYAIDAAMRRGGLTIDDIEMVILPFPDIPNGLANQVIDAAYVPEPAASTAVERGAAVLIMNDVLRGAQVTVLLAGPTFLRERVAADAFMRAYLRGLRDLNAEGWNAPAVAESVERYTRVPAATIQKILPEYADPEARVNWDSIMDQQRFYLERGYLNYGEPLDILRFADDGPRQAAIAALGR